MKMSKFRFLNVLIISMLLTASCQLPFGEKPPCGQSVLQIGDRVYQIKEIATKSDSSLKVPANKPGIAYWVNKTNGNYVFALSPVSENLALQTDKPETATVTWENCNSSTYTLGAPQTNVPDMNTILDQSISGITIFVQSDNDSFLIKGGFTSEEIQTFNTPDPNAIQAEISLLEVVPSADKSTIQVKVSVANYGQKSITLATDNVSLLLNDSHLAPLNSEPALPKEISSGSTEAFLFTFTYPETPGATIQVLGTEYDLEY